VESVVDTVLAMITEEVAAGLKGDGKPEVEIGTREATE